MTDKICNNCGEILDSSVNYCPKCKSQSFHNSNEIIVAEDNLIHKLFYWKYDEGYMLAKSKLISIIIFLYIALLTFDGNIFTILLSLMIAGIVFLIGFVFHKIIPKSSFKIKYNNYGLIKDLVNLLFYWQNDNGNFIKSKTKLISFIIFLIFTGISFYFPNNPNFLFTNVLFGVLMETPAFLIGFTIHKLTNNDNSKPVLIKENPVKIKPVNHAGEIKTQKTVTIPEYVKYKSEVNQLKDEFSVKKNNVIELIEKRFAPPQLTYTRFMDVVKSSEKLFFNQCESALIMIDMTSEYSSKIENEIKMKINVLNEIIDKLEDLTNELVLTINDSSEEEVNQLFDDMSDLIHSVKNYD